MNYTLKRIGTVREDDDGFYVQLEEEYYEGLKGLDGFGYIQLFWWFDRCDNDTSRSRLIEESPYKNSPALLGTFATRSPERPNPIALSTCYVSYIDEEKGRIGLAWIDALDGTPVLDIKPYTPSIDRVESPILPDWCAHWPMNIESSGDFDWSAEFNF